MLAGLIRFARRQRKRLRHAQILRHVDISRQGLEVGPSHLPIAPKKAGFKVKVLDHATAEELRAKYQGHGINLDAIEEVDYVWAGQRYSELVGGERFAWILASHVIEHTPDLIGFIRDCDEILDDKGVLSLAIPDCRYCFDHFRERSSLAQVIDAHEGRIINASAGTAAEYFMYAARKGERIAWNFQLPGAFTPMHTLADALDAARRVGAGEYIDLHHWCFTPSSFRLLISDLNALGYIGLRELGFGGRWGHEFFITLGREGLGPNISRSRLLSRKMRER